jgi:ketosteroid isomerase-like protein
MLPEQSIRHYTMFILLSRKFFSALAFMSISASLLTAQPEPDRFHEVVAAERAFARYAALAGISPAFAAFMADDGILFRPHAVLGKKWSEEHPGQPGLLSWAPAFGDISHDGDMGYTTGPWSYRSTAPGDTSVGRGEYITVWKRQPDGEWKVAIDLGIAHAGSFMTGNSTVRHRRRGRKKNHFQPDTDAMTSLVQADSMYADAVRRLGVVEVSIAVADSEARFYRNGYPPMIGKEAIVSVLEQYGGNASWDRLGGTVAETGDMGFTYGLAEQRNPKGGTDEGNYLRIWRRGGRGEWRIMIDVVALLPKRDE